jgi:excisionase family DNA binding protein
MIQAIKNEFLTTCEVARRLNLTSATVRVLENQKKLSAIRTPNGTRIFIAADVERLAREREEKKAARES